MIAKVVFAFLIFDFFTFYPKTITNILYGRLHTKLRSSLE